MRISRLTAPRPRTARLTCLLLAAAIGPVSGLGLPSASAREVPAAHAGWVAPVAEPLDVRRGFDPPASAWGPGHRGADLAVPTGTVVRAAGPGTVRYAGRLAGRGVVSLDHGALRTTYEPVRPLVRRGDHVTAGQPIGVLGRQGSHCAPLSCLHWGLLRGSTYLDPLMLLGGGPVRLLPVWGVTPLAIPGQRPLVSASRPRSCSTAFVCI